MKVKFIHCQNPSEFSKKPLIPIIEKSFEKKIIHSFNLKQVVGVIYSENYSCVGLISKLDSIYYLDKLAVLKEFRGKGLGNALLNEILSKYSPLIWRSSHLNPFLNFFKTKATHTYKFKQWIIFEYNKSNSLVNNKIIKYLTNKKSDFEKM